MNVPGRADGNWRWRCTEGMLSRPAFQWLGELTESSRRLLSKERLRTGGMSEALEAK